MNARLCIVPPYSFTTTVAPWGFDMECVYDYDKGEPAIFSPIEKAHPGTPPNAELIACRVGGVDITEMLSLDQREAIEEKLIAISEEPQ